MFEDVYLVDNELTLMDDAAITAAENELGITLPRGYRAILTTLGHGTYCDQVYVFLPDKIEQETAAFRDTLSEYFLWDRGTNVLPKSQIAQSLLIARSLDGDELIYHPDSEHGVYVLPRHDDTIYWLSSDFEDPMDWHADTGSPMTKPPFPYFEPAGGRACVELFTARTDQQIADVAIAIRDVLARDLETRSIKEETYELHFHKEVGSRVQLTSAYDGRIGVRIDYNPKYEPILEDCIARLESQGFYEVDRHTT